MRSQSLAVAAVLLGISGVAGADTIRNFAVAGWNVTAHTQDGTSVFSHCAAGARYNSGIFMMFAVNRQFAWSMAFHHPSWSLVKGSQYDIAFVIDGGQPMMGRASALNSNTVQIMLAEDSALFSQFRRGRQLRVAAANQVFSFNLDGTSTVLPTLVACVQQALAPAGTNPFADRSAQAPAPSPVTPVQPQSRPQAPVQPPAQTQAPSVAHQAEAAVLLGNVLATAGLPGFSIEPAEEAAKLKADAAWTAGTVFGLLKVAPNLQFNDPKLSSVLIGDDAGRCKGAFLSGALPETTEKKSVRIFTTCKEDAKTMTVYYLAVPRPKGGIYLFSTFSVASQDAVKDVDAGLREAVFQVMK